MMKDIPQIGVNVSQETPVKYEKEPNQPMSKKKVKTDL